MNDLLKRTLTGAVYVASVLAAIYFNPIISSIYFGIIGLVALSEFYNVAKNKYQISNSLLAYLTAISLYTTVALYSFNIDFKIPLLISVVLVIANFIAALYQKNENAIVGISLCQAMIANSGSILITSNQGFGGKVNKLPSIFIVIVHSSQIYSNYKEALQPLLEAIPQNISTIMPSEALKQSVIEFYLYVIEQ